LSPVGIPLPGRSGTPQAGSLADALYVQTIAENVICQHNGETNHREPQMAFELPPLPYDYDALKPYIDEETMRLHHDKHHQTYVTNANNALEGTERANRSVEEVLQNLN